MTILSLSVDVSFYSLCKIFNADCVRRHCLLTPVSRNYFTHEVYRHKRVNYTVLNKVKILTRLFPRITIFIFKSSFELIKYSRFCESSFQVSNVRHGTIESLHLIEHFQEHINNSILVLLSIGFTLGINIKKYDIRRCFCRKFHVSKNHRINNLFIINKIIQCSLISDLLVIQKVG